MGEWVSAQWVNGWRHSPIHLFTYSLIFVALSCAVFAQAGARYEVYAIRFAHVSYPLSSLVSGAERGKSVDIAFTVWLARDRAAGKNVLVDSGFYRDKFVQQWKPQDFVKPSEAVATGLGVQPADITDVIISHSHWDHADGADLFPKANVWIQREEYEYYVGANGEPLHRADADVAKMLADLKGAGRVKLVDGDDKEILPGIHVYTGGKHTYASQYVSVPTRAGTVILASDNAYLYENLEKKLAISQTLDAASNLAAQARMFTIASSPKLVIPGHDPAVFERFPAVKGNVVRID